jgi:hypothetical protein
MRAFGLVAVRLFQALLFGGAAPDTTIIAPLARPLNPSFQFRFSLEGGRELSPPATAMKLPGKAGRLPSQSTQVSSGGLQSALRYPSSDNEAASSESASLLFPKLGISGRRVPLASARLSF